MTPDTRDPAPIKLYEGCFGITRGGEGVPQEVVGPLFPYGGLGAILIAEDGDGRGWKLDGSKAWNYGFEPIFAVFPDRASAEAALTRDPAKPVQPGAPKRLRVTVAQNGVSINLVPAHFFSATYVLDEPGAPDGEVDDDALTCEGCSVRISEDAPYHYSGDGIYFCEDCAPMASDAIKQMAEALTNGEWENWYGDYYETEAELRAAHDGLAASVAEKGDYKLLTWPQETIPRPAEPAQAAQVDVTAKLAKLRETFCLASPGSDEGFAAWLEGFDAAVSIIAAAQEGRE